MSLLRTIGKVCHQDGQVHVEWKVKYIFSLSKAMDRDYQSPIFYFMGRSFYLRLYSNGQSKWSSEGWIGLYLMSGESSPPMEIEYTLGFKTAEGKIERKFTFISTFRETDTGHGSAKALERSQLRRIELTPSDVLTISAILKMVPNSIESTTDVSVQTDIEDTTSNIEIKGCQHTENSGREKVLEDIGKLWRSGENSDVVLQVEDVEFKAHRTILGARTPVLAAMFQHDTIEKAKGVVTISDCEPAIFKELLHYVYTGAPQELTMKNAPALYVVANKYLVGELKAKCLCCIRDNLSVDTFCDTALLALNYDEADLLELAVKFATKNIREIIKSVEWQKFINEHSTSANEILIKVFGAE